MIPSRMRSYEGCWTCRLRKKRCDETSPICETCASLGITCYYGADKPTWMDGGAEQRKMAEEVKKEVKRAAAYRRRTPMTVSSPVEDPRATIESGRSLGSWQHGREPVLPQVSRTSKTCTAKDSGNLRGAGHIQQNWHEHEEPTFGTNIKSPKLALEAIGENRSKPDIRSIMLYLDHFFPALFPFYNPPLLEGGRGWMVELMLNHEAILYTTLSLTTYYVSIALGGAVSGPNVCKTTAWTDLLTQMHTSFALLHQDLKALPSRITQDVIPRACEVMACIVQLERVETSIGVFENHHKHVGAATELFMQILQVANNIEAEDRLPAFYTLLNVIGRPLWTIKGRNNGAWSSSQAAFRFFSALLVMDDVVSSTSSGKVPKLIAYYDQLLLKKEGLEVRPAINLAEFVGCESFIVYQIGQICALNAWKTSKRESKQLDIMELASQAMNIRNNILSDLARLTSNLDHRSHNSGGMLSLYKSSYPLTSGNAAAIVSRIWALAALVHLSIVVSGWQPDSSEVVQNVRQAVLLLEQLPSPELIRCVVWPLCVVGCLAGITEESKLRDLIDPLVPQQLYVSVWHAREVMEKVWSRRAELTAETDLAECIRSVGYSPVLV